MLQLRVSIHENWLTDRVRNARSCSLFLSDEFFVLCCRADIGITILAMKTRQLPSPSHPLASYSD